jgi:hypothetical protein
MSPRPPSTSKAAASGLLCRADNETRRVGRASGQEVTTAVRCSRMPRSNCKEARLIAASRRSRWAPTSWRAGRQNVDATTLPSCPMTVSFPRLERGRARDLCLRLLKTNG